MKELEIKKYEHWILKLDDYHQISFPGRCQAWALRQDATFDNMNNEERSELLTVVTQWERAMAEICNHYWAHVIFPENEISQLHAHLIPRSSHNKELEGLIVIDQKLRNYPIYYGHNAVLPSDILLRIKERIIETI